MRRHLSLLTRGLAERGFVVSVAAPAGFTLETAKRTEPFLPFSPSPLLPFLPFPVPITARPHPVHDVRAAFAIAKLARTIDLIHGHGLRGAWIAALAARLARKPFVFTAHNLAPPPGWLTRALFGFAARRASAVICISQAVADSLAPYGIDFDKTAVIPNGINLAPFDVPADHESVLRALGPRLTPHPSRLIVSVGRLSPEKGFDVLARAAPAVLARFPEALFVLAGEGVERSRLEDLIRAAAVEERFLLPGYVENAAALLLAADLVAVPSRSEGQGIIALEAMAARKPVVASRVGGLVETIVNHETGVLVPPDDPIALADALIDLLGDEEKRREMGNRGRARVEERYTADRMVEETIQVYRRIIERGS